MFYLLEGDYRLWCAGSKRFGGLGYKVKGARKGFRLRNKNVPGRVLAIIIGIIGMQ